MSPCSHSSNSDTSSAAPPPCPSTLSFLALRIPTCNVPLCRSAVPPQPGFTTLPNPCYRACMLPISAAPLTLPVHGSLVPSHASQLDDEQQVACAARPPARPAPSARSSSSSPSIVHNFAFRSIAVGPSCSRKHRRSQNTRLATHGCSTASRNTLR